MKARLALAALALPALTACTSAEVLATVGLPAAQQGIDIEVLEESVEWELNAANNAQVMGVHCKSLRPDLTVCLVQDPVGDVYHYGVPVVGTERGALFQIKGEKIKEMAPDAAVKAAVSQAKTPETKK